MMLSVPVKEKKLLDVKQGEPPSWILMWHCPPEAIAGAYKGYYNKYFTVKKGDLSAISMVLAVYGLFNYCHSYKELKHEPRYKYHRRGPIWTHTLHS